MTPSDAADPTHGSDATASKALRPAAEALTA
jgi:hypothetical protein